MVNYVQRLAAGSALLATLAFAAAAAAQPVQQTLQDAWVATNQSLLQVDYGKTPPLVMKYAGTSSRNFKAMAFELPNLTATTGAARSVLVVDGTQIRRYDETATGVSPAQSLDASDPNTSGLQFVNTVASAEDGRVLFSGYSKRKRVFELWAFDSGSFNGPTLQATGVPQITDAVYVNAEDVVAGSPLAGGGLLAVADRQVLFFRAPASSDQPFNQMQTLMDVKSLPITNGTRLLSVDLIPHTDVLMLTTSNRELLTVSVSGGSINPLAETGIPDIQGRNCGHLHDQRLLVRSLRDANAENGIVSDACGQVLRYDVSDPNTLSTPSSDDTLVSDDPLVALAVGEGISVVCQPNQDCTLTSGFTTQIQSTSATDLLVLRFDNLCDPRVSGNTCGSAGAGAYDADGVLDFDSLLPPAVGNQLHDKGVDIKIPSYMFGAGPGGHFGAVLVHTDNPDKAAKFVADLDVQGLLGFHLGVKLDFSPPTNTTDLLLNTTAPILNQDIAAYAPDNPKYPTVGGFQATPAVVGKGTMRIGGRGYSAIIYGLQHDLVNTDGTAGPRCEPHDANYGTACPPHDTADDDGSGLTEYGGGLPYTLSALTGSPPSCRLDLNSESFVPFTDGAHYFVDLAACLFHDQKQLLTGPLIPDSALAPADRANILASLENTEDKLIKALNATGSSSGSQNFQSVLSQLDNYDAALAAATFNTVGDTNYQIYKNELQVRSQVFRFYLTYRTAPSIPLNGF